MSDRASPFDRKYCFYDIANVTKLILKGLSVKFC